MLIDDEDIGGYDGQRLVALRRRIGMIFQHFNLMSAKTVAEHRPAAAGGRGAPGTDRGAGRRAAATGRPGGKRDAYPAQLSGGQKQRVGIARALVHQPQILLCDEATSALDPESTQAILALLRDINRRLGLTIVLITHEMAVIREICDRVVVLECGRIVEQGEVWEVFGDPRHAVTRSLLGSLRAALPADLQARLRQAPGAGDPVLLDLQYTGASRRVPDLLAIARAIGQRVDLLHGGIERIQGRALGACCYRSARRPASFPACWPRPRWWRTRWRCSAMSPMLERLWQGFLDTLLMIGASSAIVLLVVSRWPWCWSPPGRAGSSRRACSIASWAVWSTCCARYPS